MKKIVVIGSSNVDTTLHVKDFPKPGELLLVAVRVLIRQLQLLKVELRRTLLTV